MSGYFAPRSTLTFMCTCGHRKNQHVNTKTRPNGPCTACACIAYEPEPMCECGHGKKAHDAHPEGHCKEAYKCGCKQFRPKAIV